MIGMIVGGIAAVVGCFTHTKPGTKDDEGDEVGNAGSWILIVGGCIAVVWGGIAHFA